MTLGIFGSHVGLGADEYPWGTPSPETYALQRKANDWLVANGYDTIQLTGRPDQRSCGAFRKAGLFVPKTCSGFIEPVPVSTRPPSLVAAAPRPPASEVTRPPSLRAAPRRSSVGPAATESAEVVAPPPVPSAPRLRRGWLIVGVGAAVVAGGYLLLHRNEAAR